MIGIDFSEMDASLLRYASFLAKIIQPENICLIHVQENSDIPEALREAFPEAPVPKEESLKDQIRGLLNANFTYTGATIDYQIVLGAPAKEFLHCSSIKETDLILVGHKPFAQGSGIFGAQLARKALCSVLFVPQNPDLRLRHLWVANDFSAHSRMAAEEALSLATQERPAAVSLHHVYSIPMGYYKAGKTERQFAQIMLEHAEKKHHQFLEEIDGNTDLISPFFSYDHDRFTPAEQILTYSSEADSDMILIGAKGRNALTSLFLGSVAEKVLARNKKLPLFLVKRKDASLDLRTWLRSI